MSRTARSVQELLRRRGSTLSSEQVEPRANSSTCSDDKVKFPLYVYLRDLQRSQDKKFDGLRETMNELKVQNSRLPVIALGTALLGFGFLEYVGYKARLLPYHDAASLPVPKH